MYKLVFKQKDDTHGSCNCYLNDILIDSCDMNYERRYTQAHIVLAGVFRSIGDDEVDITIEGNAKVGQYPINDIKSMAGYVPIHMCRLYSF